MDLRKLSGAQAKKETPFTDVFVDDGKQNRNLKAKKLASFILFVDMS